MTFTLLGEPAAIDLLNTLKTAHTPAVDQLDAPGALAEFWRFQSERDPAITALNAEDTRSLRTLVGALIRAIDEGSAPDTPVLTAANTILFAAPVQSYLSVREGHLHVEYTTTARTAEEATRAKLILSALELSDAATAGRLRHCPAEDCSQLFIATNAKRRWCTAAGCGNRARVSRHAARARVSPRPAR
ncbi:CGNR zinc finger domain-containing protein [Mycetocola sp. JXN-3]|uniref:CGNR zinc finger domain-containing protein n=1 Tax=Mycetocola sp. JXN-3 TaxID=2116510 RepID=UPI00165CFB1B|nr:CGNR zinc finger domain-containing protein [Mycetocola sp. JXN-3]